MSRIKGIRGKWSDNREIASSSVPWSTQERHLPQTYRTGSTRISESHPYQTFPVEIRQTCKARKARHLLTLNSPRFSRPPAKARPLYVLDMMFMPHPATLFTGSSCFAALIPNVTLAGSWCMGSRHCLFTSSLYRSRSTVKIIFSDVPLGALGNDTAFLICQSLCTGVRIKTPMVWSLLLTHDRDSERYAYCLPLFR